ncbi:MAG: DUF2244 domain-containing protein [Pseudomonadota bacterium]
MVSSNIDTEAGTVLIVLRPNQSWSWRANLWLIFSLFGIALTSGIFFLLQRYWLILPFTLAEVAIVAGCLYYCVRQTHRQEVLRLCPDTVVLERGINQVAESRRFERYFTRFTVMPPKYRGHLQTVALRCRGEETEIGSFLSPADKIELIDILKESVRFLDNFLPRSQA